MRLRKSWEFQSVKKKGVKHMGSNFWLQIAFDNEDSQTSKLGIITSRRFGNAVNRNKAKRLIREIFRKNIKSFPMGSKSVFIPKPKMLLNSFKSTEQEILSAVSNTISK